MEEKQKTLSATGFSGKYLVASLFILSGILLFARNMGWITAELFSTIVSWYSLFIILGIYSIFDDTSPFCRRNNSFVDWCLFLIGWAFMVA